MSDPVTAYFDEHIRFMRASVITDADGTGKTLADGIPATIALLKACTDNGGKLMFVGNGGSAAIATHFAMDYWHAGKMRAICFNDGAQLTCLANDHGYPEVFAMPIRMFADAGDTLIAISSSGNSENIINAVAAARERNCRVVTLSGFDPDNKLRRLGDLNYYVPARHYGHVESIHEALLHAVLDLSHSD